MTLNPKETFNQIQKFLRGLSRKQQITLGGGAGLVVLTLLFFVSLIGKSDYKPLYSGLQLEEAQSIARTLAANGTPYEMSADGTSLRVPASKLDTVRLDLASQGLPQTGRLGLELFDKPNWAGSDFAEKVNYQRALEGELERTIRSIRQVRSARVHLVLPHDSLFSGSEREAKASVVVKLSEGRLADSAIESITFLVASAVDDLRPENVTVIDADGNIPLLSRRHQPGAGQREIEEMENGLAGKLVSTLAPVVGSDGVRASVTVEYDLATSDSTQETYDPNGSVVLTSQISEEHSSDTQSQGIPGTPSNVPGASAQGAASAALDNAPGQTGQRTENKTYAISKAVRHVVQPAGGIKRIAAAILVDDAAEVKFEGGRKAESRRKRSPEEMKQIQDLAMAAIGFDPGRGDRLSVQNLSFVGMFPAGPPASLPDRLAPVVQKWMGVIRYVGLAALFVVIYLLLLRPIKRHVIAALAVEQPSLPAGALEQKALAETVSKAQEPMPDAEQDSIAEQTPRDDLSGINAQVKRTVTLKKQLVEKIRGNPEAASRLIHNWIRQSESRT